MKIPSCTYRIQFNRNFTFRYLESLLGYLEDMGVTSIYASRFYRLQNKAIMVMAVLILPV